MSHADPAEPTPGEALALFATPALRLCLCAVMSPAPGPYLYSVPAEIAELPSPGERVLVPLGGQPKVEAIVLSAMEGEAATQALAASGLGDKALRNVHMRLSGAKLPADLLGMAKFVADYYLAPLGEALRLLLPPSEHAQLVERVKLTEEGLRLAKKLDAVLLPPEAADLDPQTVELLAALGSRRSPQAFVTVETALQHERLSTRPKAEWRARLGELSKQHLVAIHCDVKVGHSKEPKPKTDEHSLPGGATGLVLTDEQEQALSTLLLALATAERAKPRRSGYQGFLLHGVTGSGKTEVYLQLIAEARRRGQSALVLVPEIALTEQLVARFRARFGTAVGLLHSALGERERSLTWNAAATGELPILVGTRSAVWASLPRLELVVVDEEHDPSYKQQDGFRYSARDIALVRAQAARIPVVLGSATPALESLANVERGKYRRLVIQARAGAALQPTIELLDVRGQDLRGGLSAALVAAMQVHLDRGEQVLLFLNRRGYSPLLMCRHCGTPQRCDHCDAFLVYHKSDDSAHCHHCDRTWSRGRRLPCCDAPDVALMGIGTERLEETVAELFPSARLCRVDRDTARSKLTLRDMLAAIAAREVDIVIGTQMLAKGLDFAAVTLVGVVDTDSRLYSLDFRAEERLAQLLVQVAGRAGRAQAPGRVVVQTFNPHHPTLRQIIDDGYDAFAARALGERRAAGLPPYCAMAILRAEAAAQGAALTYLEAARDTLLRGGDTASGLDVSYPLPALMERRSGRYRALLVLRAPGRPELARLLAARLPELAESATRARVRWAIDVDPQDTL